MEVKRNHRLNYVDYLKCFAIYLVVLGHCSINSGLMNIIYSFHLPLFFFLSGYVFDVNKYKFDFKSFTILRFRTLLIPYFKYCIYIILFLGFINIIKGTELSYDFFDIIKALVVGIRFGKCGISLWFIISLFTIQVIILFFYRLSNNNNLILFATFIISFVTIFITNGSYFRLPLYLDLSFAFLSFFEIGIISRQYNFIKTFFNNIKFLYFVFFIYLFTFLLNITYFTKAINPFFNMYGNPFLFYGASMSAIIILFTLASKIDTKLKKGNCFLEVGKNTNVIYCLHQFIILPICINCFSFLLNYVPNTLFYILISLLCIFIIMKYRKLKTILLEKKCLIGKIM